MIHRTQTPSNDQIREEAIKGLAEPKAGERSDYLDAVMNKYLKLQFQFYPMFCEDTRIANCLRKKELNLYGYRGKYVDEKGFSKDGSMKEMWIISEQLRYFMSHIHQDFWGDVNKKVRNSFMRGILRGDDSYELLGKVYKYYGSNIDTSIKEAIKL